MMWIWIFLFFAVFFGTLEIFVPSGGFLLLLTVLSLSASQIVAFYHDTTFGWVYFGCLVVFGGLFSKLFIFVWLKSPLGRRMTLEPDLEPVSSHRWATAATTAVGTVFVPVAGDVGTAKSRMLPCGKVSIRGQLFDALSEGEPIDTETPIVVLSVQGTSVIVRKQPQVCASQPTSTETVEDPFS